MSVSTLAEDVCGKRVASCKLRFGDNGELPFGSFPGAGLTQVMQLTAAMQAQILEHAKG